MRLPSRFRRECGLLIVLSKSSFVGNFDSILKMALEMVEIEEKVGILHIQDACIALTLPEYLRKIADNAVELYGLRADCEARGLLKKIDKRVRIVDYQGWVKLVMDEYGKIVSWI
jgi:sulfur relay protein TusB/DsrH